MKYSSLLLSMAAVFGNVMASTSSPGGSGGGSIHPKRMDVGAISFDNHQGPVVMKEARFGGVDDNMSSAGGTAGSVGGLEGLIARAHSCLGEGGCYGHRGSATAGGSGEGRWGDGLGLETEDGNEVVWWKGDSGSGVKDESGVDVVVLNGACVEAMETKGMSRESDCSNFLVASAVLIFVLITTTASFFLFSRLPVVGLNNSREIHGRGMITLTFSKSYRSLIIALVVLSSAVDAGGTDIEKTKADNTNELFNLKEKIKRLASSNLLRGSGAGSIESSSTAMTELKDVATSNLNLIEQMQELHTNGDKEALGEMMKSMLHDHKDFQNLIKEASDTTPDLALPDNMSFELDIFLQGFDLESIPASTLADMFHPDMYDETKEHAQGLIPILEDAGLALHNLKEHNRRLSDKKYGDEAFDFGSRSFGSSGSPRLNKDFGSKFQQGGFNLRNFKRHQATKSMMRGMKARFPGHFDKHFEGSGARRESRRRLIEEDDDCREPCDIDDRECNCKTLRECAIQLQPYDFTVLFAGGFINDSGEFTIDADFIQLFDAEGQMPEKIERIKKLAASEDADDCDKLLQEFYTVCPRDQDTCNAVNDESFHVTVDQVCDAINTPVKLLVEEIAQAYDGFPNFAGGPFIDGTVDTEIIDWYTLQEVEEGGASGDWGSCDFLCQVEWLNANVTEVFPDLITNDETLAEARAKCNESFEYCRRILNSKLEEVKEEWKELLEGSVDDTSTDIGQVIPAGSTFYSGGVWTLQGAGSIGGRSDSFHYTYLPSSGEVDVILHVQSFTSTASDATAGLMIRNTLSADSRHWSVLLSNQRLMFVGRFDDGDTTITNPMAIDIQGSDVWLKISKTKFEGQNTNTFFNIYYSEGENLKTLEWIRFTQTSGTMSDDFYIGMSIGANENDVFRASEFRVNTVLVEGSAQCDSISYNVCGDFAGAFDQMYNGRDKDKFPLENPMRRDLTKPIHPSNGIEALRLATFPVDYQVYINDQGNKQLIPGEYAYADISADFPGEVSRSTGAWTLQQDEQWVRCGRYIRGVCYAGVTEPVSVDEIHPIKCCSDTRDTVPWGTAKCPSCVPEPEIECPYRLQMNSDKIPEVDRCKVGTFSEAVAFCSLHDGRLCSSDELKKNCAVDEGCGFDNELVWSGYTHEFGADTGCLSSQNNLVLSRKAMKSCDESMALLVGSSTSVGMVKGLAKLLVNKRENDPDPMPGTCCLDTPLDSEYFGYDYDPKDGMECLNSGPFHLKVSSEACEHAGGRWNPSPCHILKDCIDDRPIPDEGHCVEDEEISCREDSSCPLFLNGTGTCSDSTESLDSVESPGLTLFERERCKSNDDCPLNSVCEDILEQDIQTPCLYDPGEFEKWAAAITIHNSTDIEQCEQARVELGFDRNEPNDIQVCLQFDEYKCDPDSIFNLLDDEIDGVSDIPPTTTKVKYPPYSPPPNEDLPWDDIHDMKAEFRLDELKERVGIRFYDDKRDKAVAALELSAAYFKQMKEYTKEGADKAFKAAELKCFAINDTLFGDVVGILCFLALLIIGNILWLSTYIATVAYHVTNISYLGLKATQPKYEKLTAKNLLKFDKWVTFALETINKNINLQHTTMRNELQDRHTIILNKVNSYTNCRVELHGYDVTRNPDTDDPAKEMLREADLKEGRQGDESCICIIYNEGCSSSSKSIENIKVSMSGNTQGAAMIKELGDIHEREENMAKSLTSISLALSVIEKKLDIVPDPEISKAKKSKKPKAIKPNNDAGEEQVPEEVFNRKLLGKENLIVVMERKLGSIESTMKDKVDKIEQKVEKLEGSMDELKDMISQLIKGQVE